MLKNFSVSIELDIVYNTITNTFTIKNNAARIDSPNESKVITMHRVLQDSEIRYGILTLGSKSPIGRRLESDQDLIVVYNGLKYQAHTHKKALGRIDRLSAIIKNFQVGDEVKLEYNTEDKTLIIEKIDN
ncbi:MAG: hypothetical protein NUV45_08700 [Tepidanaerobacteraceae bacterium]|jgi:hypothetical protein|nr:hypothetical protein [Tepidanaerobacteraceae bacterium]